MGRSPSPALLLVVVLAVLTSLSASSARKQPLANTDVSQQGSSEGDATPYNPCGHFDSNDPNDAGNAHQPCYGPDGEVWYCCLSGSSMCSCPTVVIDAPKDYGCYNYVADNTLNANTGAECGYFFPETTAHAGRILATNETCNVCPPEDLAGFKLGPTSPLLQPNFILRCYYDALPYVCEYLFTTGELTLDQNDNVCPGGAARGPCPS
ncbi:hypothetical protein KFL_000770260 [Klebsormidium nitens]|uniref:Uncharacterized protein n=1 Tax=Klebsormidium nitens TaxID=105231 RepID=A0A1Y1HT92_KLENI|nr:hypothetical protein KFL_000770260 [Klebsormidium nitens]|eukprot:GAQ81333.1 hypothetical protein KFL_000770260 [Klebsormidium nitens]